MIAVSGLVVQGHGVASGLDPDCPYPGGSISTQRPVFLRHGLDLSGYHMGTLNVDISPRTFRMRSPSIVLRGIRWTDLHPPEDFSFSNCELETDRTKVAGLIYFPHPETKERHFQSDTVVEVLAPFVFGLTYGSAVVLHVNAEQVDII